METRIRFNGPCKICGRPALFMPLCQGCRPKHDFTGDIRRVYMISKKNDNRKRGVIIR